jgi:hypothetical protein
MVIAFLFLLAPITGGARSDVKRRSVLHPAPDVEHHGTALRAQLRVRVFEAMRWEREAES